MADRPIASRLQTIVGTIARLQVQVPHPDLLESTFVCLMRLQALCTSRLIIARLDRQSPCCKHVEADGITVTSIRASRGFNRFLFSSRDNR